MLARISSLEMPRGGERHLGVRYDLARVGDPGVDLVGIPDDAGGLQPVRIAREARLGAGLAAEDAVKVGAQLIRPTVFDRMAGAAGGELALAHIRVAIGARDRRDERSGGQGEKG